jgi:hypothetical protein
MLFGMTFNVESFVGGKCSGARDVWNNAFDEGYIYPKFCYHSPPSISNRVSTVQICNQVCIMLTDFLSHGMTAMIKCGGAALLCLP